MEKCDFVTERRLGMRYNVDTREASEPPKKK